MHSEAAKAQQAHESKAPGSQDKVPSFKAGKTHRAGRSGKENRFVCGRSPAELHGESDVEVSMQLLAVHMLPQAFDAQVSLLTDRYGFDKEPRDADGRVKLVLDARMA